MTRPDDFLDHCLGLLGGAPRIRARRMFGGHGLYCDELFVALIQGGTLYLKADADSRPAFERAGCHVFDVSTAAGRQVTLGYWSAPDEAMESPPAMQPWLRLAIASALRAAASKRKATPRSKPAVERSSGAAQPTAGARRRRG